MAVDDRYIHPVPDARRLLGNIGVTKFYELVASGELTVIKIGSRSFVPDSSIRELIDSRIATARSSKSAAA